MNDNANCSEAESASLCVVSARTLLGQMLLQAAQSLSQWHSLHKVRAHKVTVKGVKDASYEQCEL